VNVIRVLGPDGWNVHVVVARAPDGLPGKTAIGFELRDLAGAGAPNKLAGRDEGCPDAHWSSGRLVRLPLAGDVLRAVLDVAKVGEYLFQRTMDREGPLDLDHGVPALVARRSATVHEIWIPKSRNMRSTPPSHTPALPAITRIGTLSFM